MFTEQDHTELADIIFNTPGYTGYKPDVIESPAGDGKLDDKKRYGHAAVKYMNSELSVEKFHRLLVAMNRAHCLAEQVAHELNVPEEFWPSFDYSALRVLEYPPGAISNPHKDYDLFTLHLYRDRPEGFVRRDAPETDRLRRARRLNKGLHLGRIGEMVGLGEAEEHEVVPVMHEAAWYQECAPGYAPQRAIVYFVMPDFDAVLPSGETVRSWVTRLTEKTRVPRQ